MTGKLVHAKLARCDIRLTVDGWRGTKRGQRNVVKLPEPPVVGDSSRRYRQAEYPSPIFEAGLNGGAVTTRTSWPRRASQSAISPVYLPMPTSSGAKLLRRVTPLTPPRT